jgi:hypothetical protein
MAIDIGLIAYQAYWKSLEALDYDCDVLLWQELGQNERNAWRASAVAVLQHIDEAKKQMEENPELIG